MKGRLSLKQLNDITIGYIDLILFFTLMIMSIIMIIHSRSETKNFGDYGNYGHGIVTLYVSKADTGNMNGFTGYLELSTHEWAHYYWDHHLTKDQLKRWSWLVKQYGYESDYNFKTTQTKGIKIQEEWAQCTALEYINQSTCNTAKRSFIIETGVIQK